MLGLLEGFKHLPGSRKIIHERGAGLRGSSRQAWGVFESEVLKVRFGTCCFESEVVRFCNWGFESNVWTVRF